METKLDKMNLLDAEAYLNNAWRTGVIGYEEYSNLINYLIMGRVR